MSRIALAAFLAGLMLVSAPVDAAKLRRGAGRQTMSFVPGDRSRSHAQSHRGHRQATRPARALPGRAARFRPGDDEGGGAAAASPGAGFKMMDGVLTYPAPARFQPKVLKRR